MSTCASSLFLLVPSKGTGPDPVLSFPAFLITWDFLLTALVVQESCQFPVKFPVRFIPHVDVLLMWGEVSSISSYSATLTLLSFFLSVSFASLVLSLSLLREHRDLMSFVICTPEVCGANRSLMHTHLGLDPTSSQSPAPDTWIWLLLNNVHDGSFHPFIQQIL